MQNHGWIDKYLSYKEIQEAYVLSYWLVAILLDLDRQYSYENIMRKVLLKNYKYYANINKVNVKGNWKLR